MKAIVRTYVYWPNMDKCLEELVHICSNCQLAVKSLRKSTLSSWLISESPWSCLHIDLGGHINGQCYFILVDVYNKWPKFFQMSRTTADETIVKLKQIFNHLEISHILVSDNGTAFTSATFSDFCALNCIKHTSPFHP